MKKSIAEETVEEELSFWRGIINAHNSKPIKWIKELYSGTRPVPEWLIPLLKKDSIIKILDIGCGPFGTIPKNNSYIVIGIDPLSSRYQKLLLENGLSPLFESIDAMAEDALDYFDANSFNIVNTDNALDHCADPAAVIKNMIMLAKPGGLIRIRIFTNEAEEAGYSGFHQWNFDLVHDRAVLWNRDSINFLDTCGFPYSTKRTTEAVREDGVIRNFLTLTIIKVSELTHPKRVIEEKIAFSLVPELSGIYFTPLKYFNSVENIFIHLRPKNGGEQTALSIKPSSSGSFFTPLPKEWKDSDIFLGQFTMNVKNGKPVFSNSWESKLT